MRIVITGATGNVGTAVLRRLRREPDVELVGVARRLPSPVSPYDEVAWHSCDVGAPGAVDVLAGIFAGADAVVHLAWQIQPSHDQVALHRTNVTGSRAVIDAAVRARIPALVAASSMGVYAAGPKDRFVAESWPATGVPTSSYSRHKVALERMLDDVENRLRVVRLRPGLIFQRGAGTEIARYFLGPLVPVRLLRFGRVPVVPDHPRLRLQAVHADDVADAYARAVLGEARGAYNIAASPVLTPRRLANIFAGTTVPVPAAALRVLAGLTWTARLQPVDPGWIDLALSAPLLDTGRAADDLGWHPTVDADTAVRELVDGMAHRAHLPGPPLSAAPDLAGRIGGVLHGRVPGTGNPY